VAKEKQPKKKNCQKCGVLYRTRCLRPHRLNKELWCRLCLIRYGENKFYTPQESITKKSDTIGKWNMTDREQWIRVQQLIGAGLNPSSAWKRVRTTCNIMKNMKRRLYGQNKDNSIEESNIKIDQKQKQKEFLEGLQCQN